MKIFLEAFVDTNFGDNLFVHTVVSRYPQHTFYMLPKAVYEASYQTLLTEESNICLIDQAKEPDFITRMDAMMVVGGDMLWEGTYLTWLKYIRTIKRKKGPVLFLGMSLFPQYSAKTKFFLRMLFHQIDVMVVRESKSYQQVKAIAPRANVIATTDMAFVTEISQYLSEKADAGVLGISVRKKIPRETKDTYEQYCQCMVDTAVSYLKTSDSHTIRFLALSKGVFDDGAVAEEIIRLCPEEYQGRMSVVSFDGSVEAYIYQMQKCESLICTRFHALVFAILLQKSFIPIIYEEKIRRLLTEIGYTGICPEYEEKWDAEQVIQHLVEEKYDEHKLMTYLKKAELFFKETDKKLQ